jgi:uncharacterized protein
MIGRKEEIGILQKLIKQQQAQLLMITGRRRIGKTFLIQQVYKKDIAFSFTGTKKGLKKSQLQKFEDKLKASTKKKLDWKPFDNWYKAFQNLTLFLQSLPKTKSKRVVFIDEFPWINYNKSGFLEEFSYWWNEYACTMNIVVAITGSDTAWMYNKIIKHKGGLHNRVTARMHLKPFTLAEAKEMLHKINPRLSDYDIVQLYMCTGGVPMYLMQVQKGESYLQSIHSICFKKDGLLHKEFDDLLASLFDYYQKHVDVLRALSSTWQGLTRAQLVTKCKLQDGGGVTKILKDLESCNFILPISPIANKKKNTLYRLADEYSRFYLQFIEGKSLNSREWQAFAGSNKAYKAWQGYSFENICIKHSDAVKQKLGIAGIASTVSSFAHPEAQNGFQVDMLIDRQDNTINLCEVKFYNKELLISKAMNEALRKKRANFIEYTKTPKTVFNTIISSFPLDAKSYTQEIDSVVTLSDLFSQVIFQ